MLSDFDFVTTATHERQGYIRCNAIGHSWHDYDSNWTPEFGTPLTLRCERCGMERRDSINDYGMLLNRHYYRPPNWKYPKHERPTKAEFRVLLLAQRIAEAHQTRTKQVGVTAS